MSFRPSEFPGGFERHCLRLIRHAYLFSNVLGEVDESPKELLKRAIAKDSAYADAFYKQFEAVLERVVALKPSEDTEIVLEVKAELDRLYTVSGSVGGDQQKVKEALTRLINLTMQTIKRAAGDKDVHAVKELQDEEDARTLHFKLLESLLVADLLNSHVDTGIFIPHEALIPTLLSTEKTVLADVVQLFDLEQVLVIIDNAEELLETVDSNLKSGGSPSDIAAVSENLEFIKGYRVYLEGDLLSN